MVQTLDPRIGTKPRDPQAIEAMLDATGMLASVVSDTDLLHEHPEGFDTILQELGHIKPIQSVIPKIKAAQLALDQANRNGEAEDIQMAYNVLSLHYTNAALLALHDICGSIMLENEGAFEEYSMQARFNKGDPSHEALYLYESDIKAIFQDLLQGFQNLDLGERYRLYEEKLIQNFKRFCREDQTAYHALHWPNLQTEQRQAFLSHIVDNTLEAAASALELRSSIPAPKIDYKDLGPRILGKAWDHENRITLHKKLLTHADPDLPIIVSWHEAGHKIDDFIFDDSIFESGLASLRHLTETFALLSDIRRTFQDIYDMFYPYDPTEKLDFERGVDGLLNEIQIRRGDRPSPTHDRGLELV